MEGRSRTLLELADLHLDALYERDGSGLVRASRDPGVRAPLFHLMCTPLGNRWLLGASLSPAHRDRVASILSVQPLLADCAEAETHPPDLETIRAAIGKHLNPPRGYRGPTFVFPDQITHHIRAQLLVDIRQAPQEGPFAWPGTAGEETHPIAIVRAGNGEVASVCYSARSTSAAAEAGVETAEVPQGGSRLDGRARVGRGGAAKRARAPLHHQLGERRLATTRARRWPRLLRRGLAREGRTIRAKAK